MGVSPLRLVGTQLLYVFPLDCQAIFKSLFSIRRNSANLENNKSMHCFSCESTLKLCQTPSASEEAAPAFARTVAFSQWKREMAKRDEKIIHFPGSFLCCTSPVIWEELLPLEKRIRREKLWLVYLFHVPTLRIGISLQYSQWMEN